MATEDNEKLKALKLTIDKLDKTYGKGSVMKLGDNTVEPIETISSGSIGLDLALGVGGYPRGRIVEIFGPESSGKTTLAIHALAETQKAGGIAAFIDAEHAFDISYAQKLGVDIENLLVSQPDHGEQALEIADALIRSGAVDIIVIDSVAALTPRSEIAVSYTHLDVYKRQVGDGIESQILPIDKALEMAIEKNLDLVEISPQANPPVCRIMDYNKFLFERKKKEKEIKAKTFQVVVKVIRLGFNIDEHDFNFKLKHAQRFLEEGNKVKVCLLYTSRCV